MKMFIWPEEFEATMEGGLFCPINCDEEVTRAPPAEVNRSYVSMLARLNRGNLTLHPRLLSEMPRLEVEQFAAAKGSGPGAPDQAQGYFDNLNPEAKKMSQVLWALKVRKGEQRLRAGCWIKCEERLVPEWAKDVKLKPEQLAAPERRAHVGLDNEDPLDIPENQKEHVAKLSKSFSVILTSKQIPWVVQGNLARQGYVTVEDLADRWGSPEQARANGPRDLEFQDGQNGFTVAISSFIYSKQYERPGRWPRCRAATPQVPQALSSPLQAAMDRRTLEETYMTTYEVPRPRLESQGSDALLKKQSKFTSRGEVGFIQVKHLVSALPEEGERPAKTSKRFTLDGWEGQEEEEIRSNPTSRRPGENALDFPNRTPDVHRSSATVQQPHTHQGGVG